MQKGKFITIEGVEGGGKSTNIPYIVDLLKARSIEVVCTREPGGTEVSEAIREVLLSPSLPGMHESTELLLMFAARSEHLQKKILPALDEGKWVVCDRFTDASYAYQGAGRGMPLERISQLENWVQGDVRPDHTILFDLDAETGLSRARNRGEFDRFEQEDIGFFNRIREQYQSMLEQSPQRYHLVEAQYSLDNVQKQLRDIIEQITK